MTRIPHLAIVEAPEKAARRELNPDAAVFAFCLSVAVGLASAAGMRWYLTHQPPATCARQLEDGRALIRYSLDADGRESQCLYQQTPHPPIVTKLQKPKKEAK